MSTITLSDKNVTNQIALIVSRRQQYSDLDLSLYHSTLTKNDIIPLTDIDAVKNSIRTLLLSNKYDRPFQPYLGANLRGFLFEPADRFTAFAMQQCVALLLKKYEPRINNVKVDIIYEEGEDRYNVQVSFNIIATQKQADMRLYLTRIR